MPRFEVWPLISGEGFVIVDRQYRVPMIGPYPSGAKGRRRAESRAAQFEADPSIAERVADGEVVAERA